MSSKWEVKEGGIVKSSLDNYVPNYLKVCLRNFRDQKVFTTDLQE